MFDRRARTADRTAARARIEAFVALRAREVAAMGPGTSGDPASALADLEASLSPILAAPTLLNAARDPESVLAELETSLSAAIARECARPAAC